MLNNLIFIFISIITSIAIAYGSTCHYVMTKEQFQKKEWLVCNVIFITIVIGYMLIWFLGLVVFAHKKLELQWNESINNVLFAIETKRRLSIGILLLFALIITFLSYPTAPTLSSQNLEHVYDDIENDSGELKRHNVIVYFGCVSIFLVIIAYFVVYQ
jgi:hypothetical protein